VDVWTDGQTERQTNMTKLTVVFRNVSNVPKNRCPCYRSCSCLDSHMSERGCAGQTGIVGSNFAQESRFLSDACSSRYL
jgi:hypothetical protein